MDIFSKNRNRKSRADKKQEPDGLSSDSDLRNDPGSGDGKCDETSQKSGPSRSLKVEECDHETSENKTGSNSPDVKRPRLNDDSSSGNEACADTSELDEFEMEYGAAADEEVKELTKGMEAQNLNANDDSDQAMLRSDNNHSFVSMNRSVFFPPPGTETPVVTPLEASGENRNDNQHVVRPVTSRATPN